MRCDYCGMWGHEYTIHPQAIADELAWQREVQANRESDEWQLDME